MTRYRNTFHKPFDVNYGPEFFEVDAQPIEHMGYLIYRRQQNCFDIVCDGDCIGMYAGLDGAKRAIETRFARTRTLRELAS